MSQRVMPLSASLAPGSQLHEPCACRCVCVSVRECVLMTCVSMSQRDMPMSAYLCVCVGGFTHVSANVSSVGVCIQWCVYIMVYMT